MAKRLFLFATLATICAIAMSFDIPSGWHIAGSSPSHYDMGIDRNVGYRSPNAATIKSINTGFRGFGCLMQVIMADPYRGKRVKMSGYMKTKDVKESAGFWMRVDKIMETNGDEVSMTSPSFDNMSDRHIFGSTDWTKYEIVLDVPPHALQIAYGALLEKTGQIWFDNITFEVVDTSVPTTQLPVYDPTYAFKMDRKKLENAKRYPIPVNTTFEQN